MKILGIETSCDETSASVVENGIKVISNVVASSKDLQKKYGGIIPEQAAREQIKTIIPVIKEALELGHLTQTSDKRIKKRKKKQKTIDHKTTIGYLKKHIDKIAITIGPGLIGSLLVGIETAKTLAFVFNKPIIPVNHLLGHIYANWLIVDRLRVNKDQLPTLPAVGLIVSGGHTLLVLMKSHNTFEILGQTRDDSAGECFDKTARMIGLSYPGGPAIQKNAEKGNSQAFHFPRPMINSNDYDFSFSGLKTAVLRETKKVNQISITENSQLVADFAASIQESIVDVLVEKTLRAVEEYKVKSVIIGGGVAANKRLRDRFQIPNSKFQIFIPAPHICTDNAAVIASAAYFTSKPVSWKAVFAKPNLAFPDL